MAVQLRPSTELSHAELARLFTASYEGYSVPFAVDEPTFGYMIEIFDLDLAESLVAFDDGTPVGLANLGRRGARTWLGGVGVVPRQRRAGIGELLTRGLLDRARAIGAKEMVLEVIVQNGAAIALYEKLGFVRTRELDVLSLARSGSGDAAAAEAAPLDAVRALVRARRDGVEPWQRDDDTIERLIRREQAPEGIVAGDAAAIFLETAPSVGLVQAAGGERGLQAILTALRAKGTVSAVNYPTGGAVAGALKTAGAEVSLRQYEMVKRL